MNKRKLFAFGDSFTFGHELSDCSGNFETIPSAKSYGALVSQQLDLEYKCLALGGYANNSISRCVIEELDNIDSDDIVLVMWTFPERHEFRFAELGFRSLHPSDNSIPLSKEYFKHIDMLSATRIDEAAKDLYIVEKLLTDKKIRYIFISADNSLEIAVKNQSNRLLRELDLSNWIFFPQNKGFYRWASEILRLDFKNKFHPPDKAHDVLFKLIIDKLNG